MGITGLLPFLKKASREANLKEFGGYTAAVDAYCWLHKGAFSCADKLVRGERTDGYVHYVMKQVNLLLNNHIKPILVFDGCRLPSKAVTEAKRKENRERNRKKAKDLLREGKIREARECFQRSVDVTSEMAADVIDACRKRNVDIIVAPYEADAQLAYLNQAGIAQLVVTEDSDLILFGCKAVLFKMDSNGGCMLVKQEKLHVSMNVPPDKFTFEKFRNMCILSGCDYLPSLHGIGLGKACKFFSAISNTDTHSVLCKLPGFLKMPQLEVTQEYRDGFIRARNTFLYQLVFDPINRILRPLNNYPDGSGAEDYPYAGKFVGHEQALQVALGNVNVQTGEMVNNFSPETHKAPKMSGWSKHGSLCSAHPSIWAKDFPRKGPVVPPIIGREMETTNGKAVTMATPVFKRRKAGPEVNDSDLTEGELQNMYCPKRLKTAEASDNTEEPHDESAVQSSFDQLPDEPETVKVTSTQLDTSVDKENDVSLEMPLKESKSRNPFAKTHSASRSGGQFSALKKFSTIRKTVVDPNMIIHSRYFAPPAVRTPPTPHNDAQPNIRSVAQRTAEMDCHSESLNEGEQEILGSNSEMRLPPKDSHPSTPKAPLSSVQSKTVLAKPKSKFQWGKLSDMEKYAYNKSIETERSPATRSAFKSVTQQKTESPMLKENEQTLSQSSDDEEISISQRSCLSELSRISDVGSLDNESFNLTPSSLPSTPEATWNTGLQGVQTSPAITSTLKEHRSPLSGSRNQRKCRTPGLPRSMTAKKKKLCDAKQLSLRDMFGFKKDGVSKLCVGPM